VIERHGPDAVGLYLSGQLLTEDYYVFNKLAKGLIGSNNVDTNSRLCMSSAVAGYKQSLGSDAPPACYDDIALAQARSSSPAPTWPGRTRCCSAGWKTRAAPTRREADRRRPAPHRDRRGRRPAPAAATRHRRGAAPRAAARDAVGRPGRPAFIAAHTAGFEALRDRVREFSPAQAAQDLRPEGGRHRAGRALVRRRAPRCRCTARA
jgi:assimilatory nitrate reductase catalytic subunit